MRKQLLISIFILLSGCAKTPIGMFKETDFVSDQKIIPLHYEDTYRNLKMGFRRCVPPEWIIDAQLYHRDKSAFFDVTLTALGFDNVARGRLYIGNITLTAIDEKSTRVEGKTRNWYENRTLGVTGSEKRERWFRWASGNLICEYISQ